MKAPFSWAIVVDIADGDIRCVGPVSTSSDAAHLPLLVERIAEDAVAGDLPEATLRIAVDFDGRFFEEAGDVGFGIFGHYTLHGIKVDDERLLVIGHPEAVESILGHGPAGNALSRSVAAHDRLEESVAIIACYATS